MMLQGKYSDRLLTVAGCLLVAVSMAAGAATRTWDGDTSTNWFDNLNWAEGFYPVATDDVSIPSGTPNAPTLTNETGSLNSFALASGQTLTVLGWTSKISAVTMTVNGTLTHGANSVTDTNALGEWVPINRVWLEGSNITIAATGEIDADYLGYPPGAGPGAGGLTYGAAAHAGDGVRGYSFQPNGLAYGDPTAPEQPGSGGGVHAQSRPAGGAIRIDATGQLTIHGELRANGQNANSTHGSGGSGGSIWLTCHTFAGSSSGLASVNGGNGNYYGSPASAGRLALDYDGTAQAALPQPRPPVRFLGTPGTRGYGEFYPAAMSSLSLPDTLLISGTLDGQRFRNTRLVIPGFTNWARASLTLDDCILGLPVGLNLQVTNDLVVTNGGGLHFFAAPVSDPLTEDGVLVEIGGDLRVYANSWIHPRCDHTNGATVRFVVTNDLVVADGGGFDADFMGYGVGKGPGTSPGTDGGGGHGGRGGQGFGGTAGGGLYDEVAAPIQAGSGGGGNTTGGYGGGAIRIKAGGKAEIHGLLTATGSHGYTTHAPAGAGGSILIECETLEGSNTGLLRADGGQGNYYGGGGGGGRIAVVYDTTSQAALPDPRPPVRFSTYAYHRTTQSEFVNNPEMGTVYFPDMTMITASPAAAVALDSYRFWHVRPVIGDGGLETWAPASLVVSNCVLEFHQGYSLDVGGDLTLSSGGSLPLELSGRVFPDPVGWHPRSVEGGLHLHAVASNELYGARLDVAGDLRIGTNAWLYSHTCGTNAAVVGIHVTGDVTIDGGGGISADDSGYVSVSGNGNGDGAGQHHYFGGGGYGGVGGGTDGGTNYGMAEFPLECGSPAGWTGWGDGYLAGSGGGAIHVQARGHLVINGTLTADGQDGSYYRGGAGSGGAIFVSGRSVSGTGAFRARGGVGNQATSTDAYGGGGRIAVWHTPIPEEIPNRIESMSMKKVVYSYPYAGFSGTLDVSAGGGATAQDGTKGFYYLIPPQGTMFVLR